MEQNSKPAWISFPGRRGRPQEAVQDAVQEAQEEAQEVVQGEADPGAWMMPGEEEACAGMHSDLMMTRTTGSEEGQQEVVQGEAQG